MRMNVKVVVTHVAATLNVSTQWEVTDVNVHQAIIWLGAAGVMVSADWLIGVILLGLDEEACRIPFYIWSTIHEYLNFFSFFLINCKPLICGT